MALDFPNSPSVNDSFSAGGKTWVYNGTKWVLLSVSLNQTVADGAITAAKLASDSVTTAKITDANITAAKLASSAVTEAKIGSGAVTQAKLTSGLSGITVTTTSLRSSVIPSPFTGQFAFMTDTNAFIRWDGSAWVTAIVTTPTEAPTSLTLDSASETTAIISFTAGADGGSAITNYQYALSTNSGSSYGSYNALATPDATSPITITGLTAGTAYYIKLKAVNAQGVSTVESNALSFSTVSLTVNYLVIAGGGSGGTDRGGGGGGGGLRSTVTATGGGGTLETALALVVNTGYTVTVGGGAATTGTPNSGGIRGSNSVFSTITSTGGGGGISADGNQGTQSGGSGGGGAGITYTAGGAGTANQGYAGGTAVYSGPNYGGGGGGGAGAVGGNGTTTVGGSGGAGTALSIAGTSVFYAGGGGAGTYSGGTGGAGGNGGGGAGRNGGSGLVGVAGTVNTGGGGGGGSGNPSAAGGLGGSGVVILRYPDAYTITIGAGLTGTTATVSSNKVTTITAGSGNVSWA